MSRKTPPEACKSERSEETELDPALDEEVRQEKDDALKHLSRFTEQVRVFP